MNSQSQSLQISVFHVNYGNLGTYDICKHLIHRIILDKQSNTTCWILYMEKKKGIDYT